MKVALITGAAKNIGREIALHLKQRGWHIIIHYYRSREEASQLASEINAQLVEADLSNPEHIESLFSKIPQPVDLLINNAAVLSKDAFNGQFKRSFFNTITVNLLAPMELSFEFIKKFNKGNIINILDASLSELQLPFISYIISKQGLETFTKLIKTNSAETRVNAIALGATMVKSNQSKKIFGEIKDKYSSDIEDVCQAIDFILSNETLNGEVLDLTKWKSSH